MPRQPYSEPPVASKVRLALHSTLTLAKLEALCDRTELDGTDKTVVAFELLGQLAHCCVRGSRDTYKRLAGERNKSALFAYLANRNPKYVHNVNPA